MALEAGKCAVGTGMGQPGCDGGFGLDLYGVGDAATTGIGLSGKLAKLALTEDEQGMYIFSHPTAGDRGKWQKALETAGVSSDMDGIRAAAEAAKREALGLGGGGGGGGSVFEVMADSKDIAAQNVQMLGDMSKKTEEMENNASSFADMAKQIRQAKEKESRFGF